jgi:MFS family permease
MRPNDCEQRQTGDVSSSGAAGRNKTAIAAFRLMTLLSTTAYNMTLPTIYLFASQLGASVEEVGLIATIANLARFALRVPIGFVSDKFGGRFMMRLGCVLVSIALFLLYVAGNLLHVISGAVLSTIGSTLIFSAGLTMAVEINRQEPEMGVSIYLVVCSASFFIAPLLCSILLLTLEIRDTYLVASAIGLASVIASGLVQRSLVKRESVKVRQSLVSILSNRTLIDGLILQVAFSLFYTVISVFFPLYESDALAFSSSEIAAIFSAYSFAIVLMRIILPRLIARIGNRILMFVSFLDLVGLMVLLPFLRNLIILSLAMFLSGLGHGIIFAVIATVVARASKPKELGLSNALNMGIGDLVGVIGPFPITVLITSFGFSALFYTVAVCMVIVAAYVAALAKL